MILETEVYGNSHFESQKNISKFGDTKFNTYRPFFC